MQTGIIRSKLRFLTKEKNMDKVEEIKRILADFTYHVESGRENNYIRVSDVFDYINDMYEVLGVENIRNKEEN